MTWPYPTGGHVGFARDSAHVGAAEAGGSLPPPTHASGRIAGADSPSCWEGMVGDTGIEPVTTPV